MTSYVTPKKNTEYIFYIGLTSQANTKIFQANPTLAAGDAKVSTDGGALGNLATIPAVTPASSKMVKVTLSASEMNGDNVTVVLSDAAGDEWCDLVINIQTTARQIDDLAFPTTSGRSIDVSATGEVEANVTQIDDLATSGNNATLNLKQLNIVNSGGHAIIASSTGGNGDGIRAVGNGSGSGLRAQGGTTGSGFYGVAGSTPGVTNAGFFGDGNVGSPGAAYYGLAQPGILAQGNGSGAGIRSVGGATGHGVQTLGGSTSGNGIHAEAQTSGDGMQLTGSGGGLDLDAAVNEFTQAAMAQFFATDSGATYAASVTGSVVKEIADNAAGTGSLTAQQVRDAMKLAPTAGAAAAGSVDVKLDDILDDTGTSGVVISTATQNSIADALLKRDWTAITGEAARSALNALRAIRNRVRINAGTMTVYEEDDATPAWTAPVTTDAAALPIIEIDPT